MKILVACEYSGIVRDAFTAKGHDATSCDLLPTEIPGKHYQGNVLDIINNGWEMLIAHPPCTYFANAGLHYLNTRPERKAQVQEMFELTLRMWNAPIRFIAIENPIGWLNTNWMKPTQIVQPYYFGDPELKTTCLWLKNLSPLTYKLKSDLFGDKTALDRPTPKGHCIRKSGRQAGKKYNYYWRQGKDGKGRSATFPGIATAMAQQWS